jgi:predicted Zn-dependent protease
MLPILSILIVSLALSAQAQEKADQEKVAALGARLADQVRRSTTAADTPAVVSYVDRLGKKLAAQFIVDVPYEFNVVTDSLTGSTHEPMALPGGQIFVSTSLISTARDEGELAGMLAHAMAHIANRHSLRTATRGEIVNYGTIPLIFVGGWIGASDNMAIPLKFVKVQRTYELEADQWAIRALSDAAYDPSAMVRYINRVQPANDDLRQAFSSLPPRSERIAALEQAIREIPVQAYPSSDEEFKRVQDLLLRDQVRTPARSREVPTLLWPEERR